MVGLNISVISLSNSERRKFQTKQFDSLGLRFEFLNAVSSEDIKDDEYQELSFDWIRQLKISELACYKSHKKLWEAISISNIPTLILEDDALIAKDLKRLLEKLKKLKNIDLVNLENRGRKKILSSHNFELFDNYKTHKLLHDTTGAAGYVLWPSGAKKLLELEKRKGIALADAQIFRCGNLNKLQIEPAPIIQLDMVNHYGISKNIPKDLSQSSVSSKFRHSPKFNFRIKRLWSEIKLGFQKFKLSFFGQKRHIKTERKEKFKAALDIHTL